MKNFFCSIFAVLILLMMGATLPSYAGGPLLVATNGEPVRWARHEVSGGPLNSETVDAQGRVIYRVDQGPLGPLSNGEAVKLVDRIFNLYSNIPTSTIKFVNGGPILDPSTRKPVDITGENAGMVLSGKSPTFQNPIIFDSDGSITGQGGVLGFFGFLNISEDTGFNTPELLEGTVVLNGGAISLIGEVPFLGVFTHEFGHFAGPLDHSQIYGWIASGDSDANVPEDLTLAQRFDIFAPFVETVYPFLFRAPAGSKLAANGFASSGYFITSLSFDDVVSLSALYPAPGYMPTEPGSQFGGISGKIVIRTSEGEIPVTGLNVVARRISRGSYPPKPDLEVFPGGKPTLDSDGIPLRPADRDEIDPLVTVTSLVSGVVGGDGEFKFTGLPPGDYMVSVERLNPDALGGSRIGPKDPQLELAVPKNYNGANESSDDNPKDFAPVTVVAGSITPGIDIILNGLGGTLKVVNEIEPNEKKSNAQILNTEMRVLDAASSTDPSKIKVDLGKQGLVGIQDLYRVDLKDVASLVIALNCENPTADFDIYLFSSNIKKKVPISSPSIANLSAGPTGSELMSTQFLNPGTYYIGVSAYKGSSKYTLTVLKQR